MQQKLLSRIRSPQKITRCKFCSRILSPQKVILRIRSPQKFQLCCTFFSEESATKWTWLGSLKNAFIHHCQRNHNLACHLCCACLASESLLEMGVLTGRSTTIHFLPWDVCVCVTPSQARPLEAQNQQPNPDLWETRKEHTLVPEAHCTSHGNSFVE